MADETQAVQPETNVNTTATAPEQKAATFTQEQVEQMIKDRLARQAEADKKKAEAEQKKIEEAKLAEQNEFKQLAEKRQKDLDEVLAKLKAKELADLRRDIAEKAGLPVALANRLQGETPEELEADAKALLATLPQTKPEEKKPGINATNPPLTAQVNETVAQQKARLYGTPPNIWETKHGGGVVEINGE